MIVVIYFIFFLYFQFVGSNSNIIGYGNEFQQFEQYELLTMPIESDYFDKINACKASVVPENGFRTYLCRYELRKYREKIRKVHHWNRQISQKDDTFQVDCKYDIIYFEDNYINGYIWNQYLVIDIQQSNCESMYNITGGSNFEVYIQSFYFIGSCNTFDYFNNSYQIYCPIPNNIETLAINDNSNNNLILSANVSIKLHYEHYDAFCDVGHNTLASLHYNIYTGPIYFYKKSILSSNEKINQNITTLNNLHSSKPMWYRRPLDDLKKTHIAIFNNNYVYDWRGQTKKYLTKSSMKQCLKRQTIWFIGESHMRYQFDITMDRYVNKLRMGRYHGNVNVSGVSYSDNTFSNNLISFLDNLPCDINQQIQTLVIQTGSWDLQFFPPRGYIRNPLQGLGVINALNRLKIRCSSLYKVIWMSTMPHPYCIAANEHCIRLMNYWRNNAAIRAVNQFMEKQLQNLNYPGLVLLDTLPIALPRFPFNDIVCVDHFLCNDEPRGFITTPTGIAIANEVLTAACNTEMQIPNSTFEDGRLLKVYNLTMYNYYTLEGGCHRQIPNELTLEYMGAEITDFQSVTLDFILNIPKCFRDMYLNRENGIMYQTYSDKTVFYMDLGYRRPMNSITTLIELGKDLNEVNFVLESDIETIPTGKLLMGKTDCNWCNK